MIQAIGGVFFKAADPAALAQWYTDKLGVEYTHSEEYQVWYCTFPVIDKDSGKETYQVFSVMKSEEETRGNTITINLRVKKLDDFIRNLKEKGIEVKGPETHPQGKFAWINDPLGHSIELWEDTNL